MLEASKILRVVWLSLLISQISACFSSQVVSFNANAESLVTLVDWGATDSEGTVIGKTPLEVPLKNLRGKIAIFSAPGRHSQYWAFPEEVGSALQANILLKEARSSIGSAEGSTDDSLSAAGLVLYSRVLMKAYHAALNDRLAEAIQLSEQLKQMAPTQAAPHTIRGLALLQEGKRDEARDAFVKAQALDPADPELARLVEMSASSEPAKGN